MLRHSPPTRTQKRLTVIQFLGLLGCGSFLAIAASRPAVSGSHGVVATPDADASRIALEVLQRGGNAVDAAVAASFALAVNFPTAGALGGRGFLLYRDPGGVTHALDFREVAPRRRTHARF